MTNNAMNNSNTKVNLSIGENVLSTITGIKSYGVFVKLNDSSTQASGFCHISELDSGFIADVAKSFHLGETKMVKLLSFDEEKNRYNVSIKQAVQSDIDCEDETNNVNSDSTTNNILEESEFNNTYQHRNEIKTVRNYYNTNSDNLMVDSSINKNNGNRYNKQQRNNMNKREYNNKYSNDDNDDDLSSMDDMIKKFHKSCEDKFKSISKRNRRRRH